MDEIYLQKVLNGDTEAFRYFVTTYKGYASSISFSILKNEYMAEEAVQEAFIKAFVKLDAYRKDSLFRTWFGRIVINESLRMIEKSKKQDLITTHDVSENERIQTESVLNSLLKEDQKRYISMVFETLPSQYALVLELFYLQDNSIQEIETMTGWSISKVKMSLSRGKKKFYSQLKLLLDKELKEIL